MKRHHRRREVKARYILPVVLVLLVAVYVCGRWLELKEQQPETRGDHEARYAYDDVIQLDGVDYRLRTEVDTMLLIGVDSDTMESPAGYRNGGQSDFLQLLVIDRSAKTVTRLEIDRDTMTPITILGVLGQNAGERVAQISLSHNFGGDEQQRCRYTAEAVSKLLRGVNIDDYLSMNMNGISALNDVLGGVTVTIEDDFTANDPTMAPGVTITLTGEQAEIFVRGRMSVGVGTNEARMVRQRAYLESAIARFDEMAAGEAYVMDMYKAMEPYITTDMSRGGLVNRVWEMKDYERRVMTIPGEHKLGSDGFMQFYPDEEALTRQVVELFYQPFTK